jgi:hypothetical protein
MLTWGVLTCGVLICGLGTLICGSGTWTRGTSTALAVVRTGNVRANELSNSRAEAAVTRGVTLDLKIERYVSIAKAPVQLGR